ncbi:MAG: DUF1641 domain-containing protein [Bacteroidales bacterium]|nr:DUF1641 domain-containing protein [Bacteroidales bacterium]
MEKIIINSDINTLNEKLDKILDYLQEQKQRRQFWEDLFEDGYRVGNEIFKASVEELDKHNLEIDPEEVKLLFLRFLKNIQTFNEMLETLRSLNDLRKDLGTVINEVIKDLTYKLAELEEKGVFARLQNILSYFQEPQMLEAIERFTFALSRAKFPEENTKLSLFKLIREMNSKETKAGLFYMLSILKLLSKTPATYSLENNHVNK